MAELDAGVLGRPDSVATAQPQDAYLLPAHSLGAQDTVAGAASAPAPEGWPSGLGLPFPAGPLDVIGRTAPAGAPNWLSLPVGRSNFHLGKSGRREGCRLLKCQAPPVVSEGPQATHLLAQLSGRGASISPSEAPRLLQGPWFPRL